MGVALDADDVDVCFDDVFGRTARPSRPRFVLVPRFFFFIGAGGGGGTRLWAGSAWGGDIIDVNIIVDVMKQKVYLLIIRS